MKDAVAREIFGELANELRSGGLRMGKPTASAVLHAESIGMQSEPGELKHLSTRRNRNQPRFRK